MGSGLSGSSGPIMGVGSNATGDSIIAVNGQTTYETWEFLYDPRIEALKAKSSLLGGAPAATSGSSLGQTNGIGGTTPGTMPGTGTDTGTTGTTGTGTAGTGTTGTTGGGTTGTTPPQ